MTTSEYAATVNISFADMELVVEAIDALQEEQERWNDTYGVGHDGVPNYGQMINALRRIAGIFSPGVHD